MCAQTTLDTVGEHGRGGRCRIERTRRQLRQEGAVDNVALAGAGVDKQIWGHFSFPKDGAGRRYPVDDGSKAREEVDEGLQGITEAANRGDFPETKIRMGPKTAAVKRCPLSTMDQRVRRTSLGRASIWPNHRFG